MAGVEDRPEKGGVVKIGYYFNDNLLATTGADGTRCTDGCMRVGCCNSENGQAAAANSRAIESIGKHMCCRKVRQ
eukprot:CAMPEP_0195024140 /NCGR_PEP_ID=MMETSP0326_2-20130528/44534_1 /TAXON_ID=2866 ORGANISM="Crypthecodinium cohnii, Strain Seligo" /NCGR_SAMPLE_ID=MMETSP0326_2 /ASSEMBLY_ACC=CAM_ASM_000348 /LENGTH=74 /DNA_ID=CAMNT_0040044807 /DNA_START=109 /DNA_END=330 /DNA_ORIENTATION=+